VHEHAEGNVHKNDGLVAIPAGHLNGMTTVVLKAYGAGSVQPTTYVEPPKEALRSSIASPFLSNGLSITRATAGTQSEVVLKFDKKASLLRCRMAILCTIILAPGDTLAYASQSSSAPARPPNAFLAQQSELLDAVQRMRRKAQDKSALQTTNSRKRKQEELKARDPTTKSKVIQHDEK
jgi:hypothetical protein